MRLSEIAGGLAPERLTLANERLLTSDRIGTDRLDGTYGQLCDECLRSRRFCLGPLDLADQVESPFSDMALFYFGRAGFPGIPDLFPHLVPKIQ